MRADPTESRGFHSRFILLTGCSGGGKSSLLAELAARGFATVPEPGRRIVSEELGSGGTALPWVDLRAFAERAFALATADLAEAERTEGPVFFDRGLIDAAVAVQFAGGRALEDMLGPRRPYARRVFVAPPWPKIFAQDTERRHGFSAAVDEHRRLLQALRTLGHEALELPKISVRERCEFVLHHLGAP
ncbi:MAG: AAA family ATPase [Pseudomonadota bacterium]